MQQNVNGSHSLIIADLCAQNRFMQNVDWHEETEQTETD